MFYISTIHLLFERPINHDYSQLLFYFITYSAKNMGRRCVFVIHQHKGKCNLLIIILLLFCLSRCLPLEPHVVDSLHIYNTLVVLITDKPRQFTVIVLFHHILFQQYSQNLRLCHLPTQRSVQFIDNHTTHRQLHVWVHCFDTTNIMISCMSLILIHMSYFYLIIILSYHLRSSEPLVVSRNLFIVDAFGTVSSFFQLRNTTLFLIAR